MSYTNGLDDPEQYFQVKAYTGNGADDHAITFDGTNAMQPDLLWIKGRASPSSGSAAWRVIDDVRGITQALPLHDTDGQFVESGDGLSSIDSDGFTLQINSGNDYNSSSKTYIAYCWKESVTSGFDMVTYTGNETARTISHGLSAKPYWILSKNYSHDGLNWKCGHEGLAGFGSAWTKYINFDENNVSGTASVTWNDTAPTTSNWSLGNSNLNTNSYNYISYLFAPKQGFSRFTTYEGSSSAEGPFIYLGFKAAMVILRKHNGGKNWNTYSIKTTDSGRGNPNDQYLECDQNGAEQSGQDIDILSNGIKIRSTSNEVNGSGNSFLVIAFAINPFVNSNGIPNNAE